MPNNELVKYQSYFQEYHNFIKTNKTCSQYDASARSIYATPYYQLLQYCYTPQSTKTHIERIFLVVPSTFNSPEILFINRNKSFIENLRGLGEVYLINWQELDEPTYSLEDYIAEIANILNHLYQKNGKPINLIGHCLGGNFAVLAAARQSKSVQTLTLLTTPINLSHLCLTDQMRKLLKLDENIKTLDIVPKIYMQILFFLLSPYQFNHKINKFHASASKVDKELFFKIEHWLMSTRNLSKRFYFELIESIADNSVSNKNIFGALSADLIKKPTCLVGAKDDRLVPIQSVRIWQEQLKNSMLIEMEGGHISYLIDDKIKIFFNKYRDFLTHQR